MVAQSMVNLFALVPAPCPALAHDVWADGTPVPPWVKEACCGSEDAHRLRPEQVHRVEGDYRIDSYPYVIPDSWLLPSRDRGWWASYGSSDGGEFSSVYCFFGPLGF